MSTLKTQYHHGDLTKSLLESASLIIKEQGVESLSMRKLADTVGVSRTAPYHHFKDKNALLCALAEQGFYEQAKMLHSLRAQKNTAEEGFKKYVHAYLEYALKHNETYDLMYGRTLWKAGNPSDSLKAASKQTFKAWIDWVEELQEQNILPSNNTPLRIGQTTWASLHGLARLFIDGIYLDTEDLTDMVEQMIKNLCSTST
ncbi:MAG: TetR/AcrR family transcriptional regulator [Gammaproteobacteria bacterium]|nr:TetR/AcrR family transcriptional regulator [Marinomonas sp. BSi20584]MBU1295220.1 TetR/AcrR family transcriptional regulator [Gammaproteobacteria bacterium]MBU1464931.1 TetR/AcrR family transcriptional regulator [Gammaproteobacteria bacterium]MBU2023996.1 TetR/AcrR family transcriptional regulator [Gammaproteobacteria bacterium]MBU2237109.1 TetR/AcrR family transcriptional regulator [Gammaproteobacteria bacterium]MBU2320278.1 TetR/AcrR family transcriptional regulator [Gammaproteobacteria b